MIFVSLYTLGVNIFYLMNYMHYFRQRINKFKIPKTMEKKILVHVHMICVFVRANNDNFCSFWLIHKWVLAWNFLVLIAFSWNLCVCVFFFFPNWATVFVWKWSSLILDKLFSCYVYMPTTEWLVFFRKNENWWNSLNWRIGNGILWRCKLLKIVTLISISMGIWTKIITFSNWITIYYYKQLDLNHN